LSAPVYTVWARLRKLKKLGLSASTSKSNPVDDSSKNSRIAELRVL
jgi:hypothetical protein